MEISTKKLRQVYLYKSNLYEGVRELREAGRHPSPLFNKISTINVVLKKLGLPLSEQELQARESQE